MSAALQIAIAFGSVAVLLGLMRGVRGLARDRDWPAEMQRKLVHIGTGLYAMTLPWLFADRWPVLMLLTLTIAVMLVLRLPRFAQGGIGAALHGVERKSYGDLLLALAVGVVFLLADAPVLYVLPLAILTLSDAAAALTGSTYGRRFFVVEDGVKSVEGSVAFFMTSFCLSMICLLVLSDTPRVNVIYLAAIVAAFGTLVEADSWRGFDNFFLPAALMLFLQTHLQTDPIVLFAIACAFGLATWAALHLARQFGLPAHVARVYVISAFLLLTVVDLPDAVLPLLVFVAHFVAGQRAPETSDHPELDCVAALALVSFLSLVSGRVGGTNNLELYGLFALCMATSFMTCAGAARGQAALWGAAAALLGIGLHIALMHPVPVRETIHVGAASLIAGAALAVVMPLLRPGWFVHNRAGVAAASALPVPLITYAAAMWNGAGG